MNKDAKYEAPGSDDIDLMLLIERVLLFFRQYKWLFAGAVVAGLLAGTWICRSLPKVYKSKLVLHSFFLTNQENIEIVNDWNELLQRHEYPELATTFHCREEVLHQVKQLKADEIQKVFTPDNPNGFTVDVTVTDNAILDELQNGLIYGLDNSPYVKDRIAFKKARLASMIEKTDAEIHRLDSTRGMMEEILTGKRKNTTPFIIDGSTINRQWVDLNEKLAGLKEEYQFTRSIQVLQNFSRFRQPSGPHLSVWLLLGVIFFVSVAYVFALLRNINLRMKARVVHASTRPVT